MGDHYFIESPPDDPDKSYEARLCRKEGTVIYPQQLSSGEKTLLWIALCMYRATDVRGIRIPSLLLLEVAPVV